MIKELSIIIPFLNEAENLGDLCSVLDAYAAKKSYKIEVVFVDDGSTDGSDKVLRKNPLKNCREQIVKLSKNYGSHIAIRAGIKNAVYDNCMFFSADLQEPVEEIDLLIEKLNEGYDYVCARKKQNGTGPVSRLISVTYSYLMRRFAVKGFPTGGANNVLFTKKIKDNLNENPENNSSFMLQILEMGYQWAIVDVSYNPRKSGSSKWTFSKRIKLLIDSFVSFSFFPIRLVTVVGILLFFAGLLTGLATLVIKQNRDPLSSLLHLKME